jgi:hypothetical protein
MRHCFEQPDLPLHAFRKALGKNRPTTLEGPLGGGKGGGSAPQPPNPYDVANATTQTNEATAGFNKALNLNNYTNPFGSQQSTQVGTDPSTGAPIYNTTLSANPQLQQAISSMLSQTGNSGNVNQNALGSLGQINDNLSNIADTQQQNAGWQSQFASNTAALAPQYAALSSQLSPTAARDAQQQGQNAAYKAQTQYLDPQFQQQQTSLESQLANQGLTPGSQAYDNAYKNFSNAKQQAYSNASNQAILTGSQIGTQNLNNQINGINTQAGLVGNQANLFGLGGQMLGNANAGLSQAAGTYGQNAGIYGQQVGIGQTPYSNLGSLAGLVPGYSGTGQSAASPANIGQNIYSNYQGQLNNYNAGTSSSNQMMGGLFGLGSSALMGYMMSDRRLKTDIEAIGPLKDGVNFYRYRYHMDAPGTVRYGLMADEVKRVQPDAVVRTPSGYDAVNYDRALGA